MYTTNTGQVTLLRSGQRGSQKLHACEVREQVFRFASMADFGRSDIITTL